VPIPVGESTGATMAVASSTTVRRPALGAAARVLIGGSSACG
jgi:hypothetical protein